MLEKEWNNTIDNLKNTVDSSTENFSQTWKNIIENKYPQIDEEQKIELEDDLKTIETKAKWNKNQLNELIKSIPLLIPVWSESLIPFINKRIIQDCSNTNINISNPTIYLYSLIWPSKTLKEQNEYIQQNNLNNTIKEEDRLTQKKIEIQNKNNETQKTKIEEQKKIENEQKKMENEQKKLEEQKQTYNKLNKLYTENSEEIRKLEMPKDFNKSSIINKLNSEDLQLFRKAFWYTFEIQDIILPNWKKQENYEIFMENDSIDYKIATLIYYYAQLNDKINQSQKKNSKIQVTNEEIQKTKDFWNLLQSLWVNSNELYESLNIRYQRGQESNNWWNKGKWIFDIKKVEDFKTAENNSSKSENNLWNLANSFDKIDSDNLKINPIFKDQFNKPKWWFDEKSLLKKFPMPKDKHILDFDINNPKLMGVIFSTLKNEKSHPLIEASTENKEKQVRAKKAMIVRLLFEANPNLKELPLKLASKLYPPKENKEQLIPTRRRKDRIEKELLIPLMYNNFCDANQEKLISEKIKEWYVKHFNNLMITTPWLNDFEIKPEEIILTNDKLKVPLYMKGQKNQTNNNLIVENWDIYITNSLYDPTNKVEWSLWKWKLYIGHMNDFKDFSENIINSIKPDVIKNSVTTKNPRIAYINQIDEIIQKPQDDRINQTQAQTAQWLSLIKVQNIAINDLLMKWHNNWEEKIDNNIVSNNNPFFNLINQYKDRKKIDVKENIHWSKILTDIINGALKGSANENERLANDLTKLTNKISDKTFNDKIEYYLKQPINNDLEKKKHSVLETLAAKNRTKWESLELFLKLFATHPEKANESINSINNISFHNFVEQLDNINDFDLLNINNINSNNPVFAELEQQYSPSAEDELANNLDDIDTTEKIETYIT